MNKLNKLEYGRSMVEMLGMLAVMGVLSVGGVAMYTSAMNKHRANELLNEASKRAAIVAAQAMTGKTGSISLGEFTQNTFSGVTFAGTANVADNKITLGLSGTGLADICVQLKNAIGDNTVMKVSQNDCSELTFNADMNKGTSEPEETCTPACSETQECVDRICVEKQTAEVTCAKNSDCNEYCSGYIESGEAVACYCRIDSDDGGSYPYINFSGQCKSITQEEQANKISEEVTTWWGARNFCKALGYRMARTSDVCESADPFENPECTELGECCWLSDCWCDRDSDSTCTCNDNSENAFTLDLSLRPSQRMLYNAALCAPVSN